MDRPPAENSRATPAGFQTHFLRLPLRLSTSLRVTTGNNSSPPFFSLTPPFHDRPGSFFFFCLHFRLTPVSYLAPCCHAAASGLAHVLPCARFFWLCGAYVHTFLSFFFYTHVRACASAPLRRCAAPLESGLSLPSLTHRCATGSLRLSALSLHTFVCIPLAFALYYWMRLSDAYWGPKGEL